MTQQTHVAALQAFRAAGAPVAARVLERGTLLWGACGSVADAFHHSASATAPIGCWEPVILGRQRQCYLAWHLSEYGA